jgi:thiol-disulfide isomerase/thioredoxin
MNKKHLLAYGAIAAGFAATGAYVGLRQHPPADPLSSVITATDGRPHSPVGALFAQSMDDARGQRQALSRHKGKALVVNFWAPWCGPCVQEMPELAALAKENAGKGIEVIGIGIDSPANIAQFAEKFKISYPLYVAGMSGSELSRSFGNAGGSLPYTVLIGADGQVRKTYLGRLRFEELKADLAAL